MTLNHSSGGYKKVADLEEPPSQTEDFAKVHAVGEACPQSLWLRFKMMMSIAIPTILTDFVQRT